MVNHSTTCIFIRDINDILSLPHQVSYVGTGRNRFQLEVPDSACKRVPAHYEVTGQRKGYKRYITSQTKHLLGELTEAEDKQVLALKDTMRRIFNKFDER